MTIKKLYGLFLKCLAIFVGEDRCKMLDTYWRFHIKLDLKDPRSLPEKICWLSLHGNRTLMSVCADKWAVRDYIRSKKMGNLLIPIYGNVIRKAEELDISSYPNQFVLKATHGCKMNAVYTNKEELDQHSCQKMVKKWLTTHYGAYSVEPHYEAIVAGVYCEAYLGDASELLDYKFFCYNGEPNWILVCGERNISSKGESQVQMYAFNTKWEPIQVIRGWKYHQKGCKNVKKPEKLEEMLKIASKLSEDFDFVRVDLYEVNGQIYFGELTFTPGSGVLPAYDPDFLLEEGKKLKITEGKRI